MKSEIRVLAFLLSVCVLATLTGCAKNTSSNVAEMRMKPEGIDKRIIINHRGLAKKVTFYGLGMRSVGDIPQARVVLKSNKKNTIPFAYRFEWFDEDGFPIESGVSIWKNDWLKGFQELTLTGTGPSGKAVDVRLHFRQVDN